MKNKIFFSIYIALLFTTLHSAVFAQVKYYPGYVILLNGDTLKGELKKNPKKEIDNYKKAAYRKNEGDVIKSFAPTKIKEYSVDGVIFVSRKIDDEQVFVKLISKGALCLYQAQMEEVQMNDLKVKTDYYMEKAGEETPVKIKSGKFKKQMQEAMADNDDIMQGLENKTYEYENIVEVFNAYNKAAKN